MKAAEVAGLFLAFLAGRSDNPRPFSPANPSLHLNLECGARLAAAELRDKVGACASVGSWWQRLPFFPWRSSLRRAVVHAIRRHLPTVAQVEAFLRG